MNFKFPRVSLSTIGSFLLLGFTLLLFFSPDTKGWTIQQLMNIGFFQPSLDKAAQVKELAPADIAFRDGKGNIVRLSDLKGKVVFINFWATWCPPCRAEMPSIHKLSQNLKDNKNILFLMVDVDNNYQKAQDFMDRKKFSLPVYTPASTIPESLLDGSIPTTAIFNKEGKLVAKHTGAGDFSGEKVKDYLNTLSNK